MTGFGNSVFPFNLVISVFSNVKFMLIRVEHEPESQVAEETKERSMVTGLRPIYVMFFKFLLISFHMKNNDDMLL